MHCGGYSLPQSRFGLAMNFLFQLVMSLSPTEIYLCVHHCKPLPEHSGNMFALYCLGILQLILVGYLIFQLSEFLSDWKRMK